VATEGGTAPGHGGIPFWLDEAAPPIARQRVAVPEVEVVGGGITGLSCARALAEAGRAVRVYEAREVGSGASGRNGGFALRGTASPFHAAVEELGERAVHLWRLTEQTIDGMEAMGGDAVRRTGSLRLAADAAERDELRREHAALDARGFRAEWVDGERLGAPLRGRFTGAIFHPPDASLQPARFARRLAALAADAGVEIRERTRVTPCDLSADVVVVATDGYPSGLLGSLEGLIIPTRGQMIATAPLSARLFECPHYGRRGFDYWQQTPDGRLLAGGFRDWSLVSEFTDEEVTTPTIQRALEDFVAELAGVRPLVTHRWAGLFGLVPDLLPVVGRVPGSDRMWVAGGFSGHGNVLGVLCGELVAQAILGRPALELDLFEPARLVGTS